MKEITIKTNEMGKVKSPIFKRQTGKLFTGFTSIVMSIHIVHFRVCVCIVCTIHMEYAIRNLKKCILFLKKCKTKRAKWTKCFCFATLISIIVFVRVFL